MALSDFCQLTSARCPCKEASTSAPSPRRWDSAPEPRCEVFAQKLVSLPGSVNSVMSDADATGMYALRERRQYVGQEDFEMAVAKVLKKNAESNTSTNKLFT